MSSTIGNCAFDMLKKFKNKLRCQVKKKNGVDGEMPSFVLDPFCGHPQTSVCDHSDDSFARWLNQYSTVKPTRMAAERRFANGFGVCS